MWQDGLRRGRARARLLAQPSLQFRLVALVLCLVAAGAVIITAASDAAARGYLLQQADQQLRAYADRLTSRPFTVTPISRAAPGTASPGGSGGGPFSIEVRSPGGQLVMSAGTQPGPALSAAAASIPARGQLATVPAGRGGSWLVIAEPVHYRAQRIPFAYGADDFSLLITGQGRPGVAGTLVAGLDMASIGRAIGRLTVTCLAVGAATILVAAALSVGMIRTILRPLTRVGQTAAALGPSELSRRIPGHRTRADTGRLAGSLNGMLSQIEHAFTETATSEAAARSSAERMRRILADTGHELRRPLSILRGLAESYRPGGQLRTGELDRMMRQVADEAARMQALVDDQLPPPRPTPAGQVRGREPGSFGPPGSREGPPL